MAERELSILVRAKGALQASKDIGKVDSAVSKLGRTASTGLKTAGRNIAVLGAGIAVGIGAAVHSGIKSLAELENATTAVEGAIKQTGMSGGVTAKQVATWANEIESSVQAAFDDKEIVQATASLIRFGKVTPTNLRPAMQVITDLAVKTGSVEGAAELLGKALADPTKAAGKLARSGVILTKAQQDQIKAFMKVNNLAGAQKVILDSLSKTTAGAAADSVGEYGDALNMLSDASEDVKKALAEGFLPVIKRVADILNRELAKPSTIAAIREFGEDLAAGLDDLVDIAQKLPWQQIGDSLKLAGAGAKAVLSAFSSLPPWVQTAVLTGWGLNKLTGGALGSIVGQLATGLIKGVLGIQAGVVNVTGGVVNTGGVPGGGGGKGGIPGALAGGGAVAIGAGTAVVTAAMAVAKVVGDELNKVLPKAGVKSQVATDFTIGGIIPTSLNNIKTAIDMLTTAQNRPKPNPAFDRMADTIHRQGERTSAAAEATTRAVNTTNNRLENLRAQRPRVSVNVTNNISFSAFLKTGSTRAALTGRVSQAV